MNGTKKLSPFEKESCSNTAPRSSIAGLKKEDKNRCLPFAKGVGLPVVLRGRGI